MSTDKSLVALLRALQNPANDEETYRLLGSASTLLTILSNPLNVTLLTSQLLSLPSIWQLSPQLETTSRFLGIFSTASLRVAEQEEKRAIRTDISGRKILPQEEWILAVIRGANEKSPRWRHVCVLAGLLVGLANYEGRPAPGSLRQIVESALITAINAAVKEGECKDDLAASSIALILGQTSDLLSSYRRFDLDFKLLLPIVFEASFLSKNGLHSGYFLSTIDSDVVQLGASKFQWSPKSATFIQLQQMSRTPLINILGPLARLISFAIEHSIPYDSLAKTITDLSAFTRCLCLQWRQNKFSEIDITEESKFLSEETLRMTLPLLWHTLRSSMFAIVVILKPLLGRTISDGRFPKEMAPFIAAQTLHILRDIYFISSRMGGSSFSQYSFGFYSAIDILSQYPTDAEVFLREIQPSIQDSKAQHPLDRCQDLYFLNTAEHFAILLSPQTNEELLLRAALPYLTEASDERLLEIFEAAHSVMLAVISAPQNSQLLSKHLHPYLETLFNVFPLNITPRQFRYAIRTLVRITSPPSPISQVQPLLPSTILELVLGRVQTASEAPLSHAHKQDYSSTSLSLSQQVQGKINLSERSVLVLALIDALPFLPLDQLEDFLPVVADAVQAVHDTNQLNECRERFWEVLSNGEMDISRSAICLSWWGTGAGQQLVMKGERRGQELPLMSGALVESSRL